MGKDYLGSDQRKVNEVKKDEKIQGGEGGGGEGGDDACLGVLLFCVLFAHVPVLLFSSGRG